MDVDITALLYSEAVVERMALCRGRHKAHLLRRCRLLQEDDPHATLPRQVYMILRDALAWRDRH